MTSLVTPTPSPRHALAVVRPPRPEALGPAEARPPGRRPSDPAPAPRVLVVGSLGPLGEAGADGTVGGYRIEAVASADRARPGAVHGCAVLVVARWAEGALGLVEGLYRRAGRPAVVVVTREGRPTDAVEALAAGADDHLAWPARLEELWARVGRLAAPHGAPGRPGRLALGPLEIDQGLRQVRMAGVAVPLTATQFDLLVILAEAGERTVRAQELLGRAWDAHQHATTDLLRPQLVRLRRALGGLVDVRSVRGVGYRLAVADGGPPADGVEQDTAASTGG